MLLDSQVEHSKTGNRTGGGLNWPPVFALLSAALLGAYVVFSAGLKALASGWTYYGQLFDMVFPGGSFASSWTNHLPPVPPLPGSAEGYLLAAFAAACLLSGALGHLLFGERRDLGPNVLLFSLAAALVPSLVLALVFWPDGRGALRADVAVLGAGFVAVLLGGCKLALAVSRRGPTQEAAEAGDTPAPAAASGRGAWLWAALFLLPAAGVFAMVYARACQSIHGYDATAYHLPLAASWWKNARITTGYDIQYHMPGNAELLMRWGFAGGSEQFVNIVPFLATLLCLYMVYAVARALGQSRPAAIVAGCCTATFPIIPFLGATAYADTLSLLFLLCAVYFLLRWNDSGGQNEPTLLRTGLAVGLALGTKLSVLPAVFLILLAAGWLLVRSPDCWLAPERGSDRPNSELTLNRSWLLRNLLLFSVPAFFGGAYWYIRNLFEHGNPLYPISILGLPGLTGREITGQGFAPSQWLTFPWTELIYGSPFDNGNGAVFAAVALPALLGWLWLRKHAGGSPGTNLVWFLTAGALLLFVLANPITMRYAIFPISLSFVFVGEVWTRTRSFLVRAVTFAAYALMMTVIAVTLAGGHLYEHLRRDLPRAEKLSVPVAIDEIPPSRIFNAAPAFHTYGLLGRDYRHDVVSLFREGKPEDLETYQPAYVLLTAKQEERFQAKAQLKKIGQTPGENHVSLWKVIGKTAAVEP